MEFIYFVSGSPPPGLIFLAARRCREAFFAALRAGFFAAPLRTVARFAAFLLAGFFLAVMGDIRAPEMNGGAPKLEV